MNRRGRKRAIITSIILIIILFSISVALIKKFTPSKEIMPLEDYYGSKKDEVSVVLQDELYEKKGIVIDNVIYIDYATVETKFNKRFYWDANENVLIYTTPSEVIKAEVGSKNYYVNKSKNNVNYSIVKTDGDNVYIALDFVKQYSDIKYEEYDNPKRVVIDYKWGDYLFAKIKKDSKLRLEPNIKSDILVNLKAGDTVTLINTSEEIQNNFTKVITKNGVIGYIKNKYVKDSYYETLESDYKEPIYTNISNDYKVNLVWHQVTNQDANNNVLNLLTSTKSVTTISPTWFSVSGEEGSISSLASETYVDKMHELGLEVWALVDDFSSDIKMYNLLSYTSRREKLVNELIANAIKYNLDGLNIDFENITSEAGIHYVQFLRELSIKCRNNGIVLSIDNYVPMPYSKYYDIEEQGKIADYVITMAYDEHHAASEESGSVSSISYVETGIKNTIEKVPKNKVIIAIPFYTRLWKEVKNGDSIKVSSESYAMSNADSLLEDNGVKTKWDEETKQYYGQYESDGATYKMWLEEEKSIEEKMKVINEYDIAGVAEWKLGLEKESIWDVIIKYVN